MAKRISKRLYKSNKKQHSRGSVSLLPPSNNKTFKNKIRSLNPDIFHFNLDSSFIYQPLFSNSYYEKLNNKNHMKLDISESNFLISYINSFKESTEQNFYYVLPFFKELISNIKTRNFNINNRATIIREIIEKLNLNSSASINKIKEEYNKIAVNHNQKCLSRSSIYKIIKNELKYKYRKTSVKTSKILSNTYIKYCFFLIKILVRGLKQGADIIFLDESGFHTKNNNYYTWRRKEEEIYNHLDENKKFNLLIAVSKNKIIKYKIIEESTNEANFYKFMEEMVKSLRETEKKKSIILMDNCSSHLTSKLFKFYYDNNLKIVFNVPYYSKFNMVENVFRYIKKYTYGKLYNNLNQLKKDVQDIIEEISKKDILKKLFIETLYIYSKYEEDYSHYNLNNL